MVWLWESLINRQVYSIDSPSCDASKLLTENFLVPEKGDKLTEHIRNQQKSNLS